MRIANSTSLQSRFADAVACTRAALARQSFGVLTEIDMKATLKKKPAPGSSCGGRENGLPTDDITDIPRAAS